MFILLYRRQREKIKIVLGITSLFFNLHQPHATTPGTDSEAPARTAGENNVPAADTSYR